LLIFSRELPAKFDRFSRKVSMPSTVLDSQDLIKQHEKVHGPSEASQPRSGVLKLPAGCTPSPSLVDTTHFTDDALFPADRRLYLDMKRALDIVGALVGIVLALPPVALAALLIWWEDRGPAFFIQERVGKDGRRFRCFKLRTMFVNADAMKEELMEQNVHSDCRTFKHDNDPRITKVGRWLRKYSIDEFPQFLNVLLGQMSLVGPRPAVPAEVELYSDEDRVRLLVKPGLTCFWQISGRSSLPFSTQIKLDEKYIREMNMQTDLSIIFRTIPALISCRGAR